MQEQGQKGLIHKNKYRKKNQTVNADEKAVELPSATTTHSHTSTTAYTWLCESVQVVWGCYY